MGTGRCAGTGAWLPRTCHGLSFPGLRVQDLAMAERVVQVDGDSARCRAESTSQIRTEEPDYHCVLRLGHFQRLRLVRVAAEGGHSHAEGLIVMANRDRVPGGQSAAARARRGDTNRFTSAPVVGASAGGKQTGCGEDHGDRLHGSWTVSVGQWFRPTMPRKCRDAALGKDEDAASPPAFHGCHPWLGSAVVRVAPSGP